MPWTGFSAVPCTTSLGKNILVVSECLFLSSRDERKFAEVVPKY